MVNDLLSDNELKAKLISKGHTVSRLGRFKAGIDGQVAYVRRGSDKRPKGWQITIRDDFRSSLLNGKDFLLVPRGRGLLIPLRELRRIIGTELGDTNTVDVFFTFGGVCTMECKGEFYDMSAFLL